MDTYIPELRLAIEVEGTTVTEQRTQIVKKHICDCNGIKYILIKQTDDNLKIAQLTKEAFRKCHIFFSTDDEKDIETLRKRFKAWRKTK